MARVRLDQGSLGAFQDVRRGEHDRPRYQGFPGLWPRLALPLTGYGVLLYQDGPTAVLVDSWDNFDAYVAADERIAGGHVYECDEGSWQHTALVALGATFSPVEG